MIILAFMSKCLSAIAFCFLLANQVSCRQTPAFQGQSMQALPPASPAQQSDADHLQQEKLREEIRKLRLENEALSKPLESKVIQFLPLIIAFIAALVALLTPQVTSAKQAAEDRRKEIRLAIAQFGAKYAAAIHYIQWLTWKPKNGMPLTESDLDEYDEKMHQLFPELVANFLIASALTQRLQNSLRELYAGIIFQDSEISIHLSNLRKTGTDDGVALAKIHDKVNALWDQAPQKLADLMNTASRLLWWRF